MGLDQILHLASNIKLGALGHGLGLNLKSAQSRLLKAHQKLRPLTILGTCPS